MLRSMKVAYARVGVSMNFLERLSSAIYNKQMLFKQDNGIYYSKYHDCEIERDEAEEWLLDTVKSESEISNHNYLVGKEREEIGYRRMIKLCDYLKSTGLSDKEINNIIKLEEEI